MRVIVCGSRRWHDRKAIEDRLYDLVIDNPSEGNITIVHGDAPGADRIAHQEAQKAGLLVERHPYKRFVGGSTSMKRAPLVRNEHMARLGADLCLAFWDGRSTGTAHMMDEARKRGIPVEVVWL
jgi:SLOG family YspA-like protein